MNPSHDEREHPNPPPRHLTRSPEYQRPARAMSDFLNATDEDVTTDDVSKVLEWALATAQLADSTCDRCRQDHGYDYDALLFPIDLVETATRNGVMRRYHYTCPRHDPPHRYTVGWGTSMVNPLPAQRLDAVSAVLAGISLTPADLSDDLLDVVQRHVEGNRGA